MSPLLLRELRRLAPYGLGAAGLILSSLFLFGGDAPSDWAIPLFLLGSFLGPAVLGVASVAPDSSSGGAAFLVRLPLSPAQVLRRKLVAALAWTLLVSGATLTVFALTPELQRGAGLERLVDLLRAQVLALGIGCAASVLTPRVLPAVLLAPSLGLVCLLVLLGVPLVAWRIPPTEGLGQVVAPALGLLALAAASLAFLRGEPHQASIRPTLLVGAVLGPGLLLGVGATGAAHAWTVQAVVPELKVGPVPGVAAPGLPLVAVSLHGRGWTGLEERVAVMAGRMVFSGEETAAVLPQRGVEGPEFSPDGERLLLRASADPGGWLVDLRTGRSQRLPGLAPVGFGFPWVVWRGGAPLLVRASGDSLEVFRPEPAAATLEDEALAPWLIRVRLEGLRLAGALLDGRVALEGPDGVFAHDPPQPTPSLGGGQVTALNGPGARLCAWEREVQTLAVAVSPRGATVLRVRADDPQALEVYSGDRAQRVPAVVPAGLGERALSRERVGWSSEERFVAVAGGEGRVAVVDLQAGRLVTWLGEDAGAAQARAPMQRALSGPVVWSSGSDAWVALPTGELFDLRAGVRSLLPVPVAAGVGAERFVPLGLPLQRALEGRDRISGGAR